MLHIFGFLVVKPFLFRTRKQAIKYLYRRLFVTSTPQANKRKEKCFTMATIVSTFCSLFLVFSQRVFLLKIDETIRQLDNALNLWDNDDDFMLCHSPLHNAKLKNLRYFHDIAVHILIKKLLESLEFQAMSKKWNVEEKRKKKYANLMNKVKCIMKRATKGTCTHNGLIVDIVSMARIQ